MRNTMKKYDLGTLARKDALELIKTGAPVYVLVNPVENHGPHLPLQTDYLLSLGATQDLHLRFLAEGKDWPLLIYPVLHLGAGPAPGLGSVHTSYAEIKSLVHGVALSLVELGAKTVIWMTFHGDPFHNSAIQKGVDFLNAQGVISFAPFHFVLNEMLEMNSKTFGVPLKLIESEKDRKEMAKGLGFDFHAGFFETSLVLHYSPDSVSEIYKQLPPCPKGHEPRWMLMMAKIVEKWGNRRLASEWRLISFVKGWTGLDPFPGYTGKPHCSSAAVGQYFAKRIVEIYYDFAKQFLMDPKNTPLPKLPLDWVLVPTLNGRLGV